MEALTVILITSCCIALFTEVESKYCPYPNNRNLRTICASYEYCCGRGSGCCRSQTLTFYQLWYFWLSVFLILLLCSGGGWWYRFKYRNHIYTQQTGAPGTNAFYYPNSDRVFFQNSYKNQRYSHRPYSAQMSYNPQNAIYNNTQQQQQQQTPQHPQMYPCPPPAPGFRNFVNLPPTAYANSPAPPPPYTGPPPSYDSILHQSKE